MLVQFSIKNFRSIRDEIVISLLASADSEHESDLIVVDQKKKKRLTAVAAIYGANASGKSNILLAMQTMQDMVTGKSAQLLKDKPLPFQPFSFDNETPLEPTEFGVIYYYNGIKYEYTYSYAREHIVSESLYHWPNGREALVFSRELTEYKFAENIKEQQTLASRTPGNKLYLVSSNEWNAPQTELAYRWFTEKLLPYDTHDTPDTTIKAIKGNFNDNPVRDRIVRELLHADLGIINVGVTEYKNSEKPIVLMTHRTKEAEGWRNFPMPLEQESLGTQRFFSRIGPWIDALDKGGILFVDEMDSSMHPLLTKRLVEMMQDSEINTNHAQLIFTTHDSFLLDLTLLRRDQIWFTEKDPDTLGTNLFSMWDFSVRKDENIQKGYLLGKYGAIPFIGGDI